MRRRTFLTTTTLVLAGCASSEDDTEDVETQTTTPSDDSDDSDATTEEPTEETTTEPSGEPAIEIVDHELVVDEGEYSTDVYVAATIENTGDAPSGQIELTADWYDQDGNYLDNDSGYLQTLGAGETWAARVYYLGGDGEAVDDYEFDGEFQTTLPTLDGVELTTSEMQVGEDEAVIAGEAENTRDESVRYAEAIAKVYDSEGVVIGGNFTNVSDLPAGETWSFETTWRGRDRTSEAADHTVVISE